MRERAQQRLDAMPVGQFAGVSIYRDRVERGGESHPLGEVTARVESGSDLEKRVTLTRLVGIGAFALLAKKKTGGEAYLTIEGPDFFWTEEVDRKRRPDAQRFAGAVNNWARQATPATP